MNIDMHAQSFRCCLEISYSSVKNLVSQLWDYLSSITDEKINIDDLTRFLDYTTNLLHENHYLRLIAKRYLSQLLSNEDPDKVDLCLQLLQVFGQLDPGLSHSRGMTMYELYKAGSTIKRNQTEIISCLKIEPKDSLAGRACELVEKDTTP